MKRKVLGYVRVSGAGQVDGDGPTRQKRAIRAYAKANNLDVVAIHDDLAVTGVSDCQGREGLSALIEQATKESIDLFIVENATRLARDFVSQEFIIEQLRQARLKVIDTAGNDLSASSDDPTKKLIRQILACFAEFEKTNLVLKLRAARERRRNQGIKVEGRPSYREQDHEAIRIIRSMRRQKKSYQKIADRLNEQGMLTMKGTEWSRQLVFKVFKG